jgi:hypothetical protein
MKKAIVVLCALALVATATAKIELFLKDGGVSSYIFDQGNRNYLPYFDHGAGAVVDMGQCLVQTTPLDRTFFVWGRFDNEPIGAKIMGIRLNVWVGDGCEGGGPGNLTITQSAAYRHAKANGVTAARWTRWDGALALTINGVMAAVTNKGIVNDSSNAYDLVADYGDEDGEAEFLLGAIRVQSSAAPVGTIHLGLLVGGPGFYMNDQGDPSLSYYPEVQEGLTGDAMLQAMDHTQPPIGTPATFAAPMYIGWKPEPATLVLIGLGLLLRRR